MLTTITNKAITKSDNEYKLMQLVCKSYYIEQLAISQSTKNTIQLLNNLYIEFNNCV